MKTVHCMRNGSVIWIHPDGGLSWEAKRAGNQTYHMDVDAAYELYLHLESIFDSNDWWMRDEDEGGDGDGA